MHLLAFTRPTGILRLGHILCLSLLFGLTATASETAPTRVPFELDEYQRLAVELTFHNGVTANGVIDTAATFPMVDGQTARAVGLELERVEDRRFVTVIGLGGPEDFPLIDVPSMSAGDINMVDVSVALDEHPSVAGVKNILPVDTLQGDVLDFDFERGLLTAYNDKPVGSKRTILSQMPMVEQGGLYFVEVTINKTKGLALIDTGSSITYINTRFADDSNSRTNEEKTQRLKGIAGVDYDVRISRVARLSIGELDFKRFDILVSDPLLFESLGMAEQPMMILGMDLMSKFRVQMDRKTNTLYLRARRDTPRICTLCVGLDGRASRLQ